MSRFTGKITWPGGQLDLGGRTLVMGVVNVTPDSFSDGGLYLDPLKAIEHGLLLAGDGADILDVGGQSTRPGSDPVDVQEQIHRTVPVIRELSRQIDIPISIDTNIARVAEAALDAGAGIINDIAALRDDPAMAALAADREIPVILMHMKGTPKTMQQDPQYRDVVGEVKQFLTDAVERAVEAGISRDHIVIDPGIGFGKRSADNLRLLGAVHDLLETGRPVLIGASRKRFIGEILDRPVDQRLYGSLATIAHAAAAGVHIVRAHDVKAAFDVVRMIHAIQHAG